MKKKFLILMIFILGLLNAETIWEDNFETETGWILSGEFEIDLPQGLGGEHGGPDPQTAFEEEKVLGVDLTGSGGYPGDYETSLGDREYYAITPPIDCSSFIDVQLSFQKWLNVEQPTYDHAYIDVSIDGGTTWIEIWTNSEEITNSSWANDEYDISDFADLKSDLRVRFSIGPTDGSWQYSGWNIDLFKISGTEVEYGAIGGIVEDSSNGEPISFAQVMSQFGNTISNDEGEFLLTNIPEGNRSINVNALGYIPFEMGNIIVNANDTTSVLCQLQIDPDIPPEPQNLTAEVVGGNNVQLNWDEPNLPIEELLAYNIYRNGIIVQSVLNEQYLDMNLINGDYSYFVSAVYDTGESLPSDSVNVQINVLSLDDTVLEKQCYNLRNYPNPFNPSSAGRSPSTTISFNLSNGQHQQNGKIELEIYNIKGQKVKALECVNRVDTKATKSLSHSVIWNGKNDNGKPVASGVYYYQLKINNEPVASKKCLLLK